MILHLTCAFEVIKLPKERVIALFHHFLLQFLHVVEISQKAYNTTTSRPSVPCILQILTTFNLYSGRPRVLETSGVVLNSIEKQDGRFVAMVTKNLQTLNLKFYQVMLNSPWCTHDIAPMYSWYRPDVLMISPQCTHDVAPMYSWYPPMYWTHIIQGVNT